MHKIKNKACVIAAVFSLVSCIDIDSLDIPSNQLLASYEVHVFSHKTDYVQARLYKTIDYDAPPPGFSNPLPENSLVKLSDEDRLSAQALGQEQPFSRTNTLNPLELTYKASFEPLQAGSNVQVTFNRANGDTLQSDITLGDYPIVSLPLDNTNYNQQDSINIVWTPLSADITASNIGIAYSLFCQSLSGRTPLAATDLSRFLVADSGNHSIPVADILAHGRSIFDSTPIEDEYDSCDLTLEIARAESINIDTDGYASGSKLRALMIIEQTHTITLN